MHLSLQVVATLLAVAAASDLRPRSDPAFMLDRYGLEAGRPDERCRKPVKCIPMKYNSCLGTQLDYKTTTLDFIPERVTQEAVQARLQLLQAARHIPKCWTVVQPLLCSLFMPQCTAGEAALPSQELCRKVLGPCRLLLNETIWPGFIKCDNTTLFPPMCTDHFVVKFNHSGKCLKPLISTDNSQAVFDGVDGCGAQCNDPFYTADEHKQIHSFIAWGAGICGIFNLFTVVTFLIDWRSANKYPALVIFYINCCFLVSCVGWLAQFSSGSRDSIVCRKDGTRRMGEPSGENLFCVVVFVLIYYSSMAAMTWFVILTYTWHMSFQALGKIHDRIDKKSAYFHLIAWCFPLVLTVTVIALGEIDGNSVTGICFVGYINYGVRIGFVLVPVLASVLIGGYLLSRGLIRLIRLKISSHEIISERASAKIRGTIIRVGCFSALTFMAVMITFYCHCYELLNSWKWHQSFRNFVICSITTSYADESECKLEYRPSVTKLQLHLLAPFLIGVLMSLWVWTSSTVDTWSRFLRRIFNCSHEEPVKLKKHKVIAQAFAKRKTFNNAGRISISFRNTHEDPVGLNFSLSSVASQDFSSTWAAALPKFVTRRGAFLRPNSVSSNRRNSVDSEISFSVQRVSVHSRRNSLDSQISVQISEVKATRKVASASGGRGKRGKRIRDFRKTRPGKSGPLFRRGSTTSQESQLGAQILSALAISDGAVAQVPNMKRRSAVSGSAGRECKVLEGNAGILLPILFPTSDSDDTSEEKRANVDLEAGNKSDSDSGEDEKLGQDDAALQRLLRDTPEKTKDELASSLSSFCPELCRIMPDAREMATQTSVPLDVLEMQELQESINEIVNSRNCTSKGTQISPQLNKTSRKSEGSPKKKNKERRNDKIAYKNV